MRNVAKHTSTTIHILFMLLLPPYPKVDNTKKVGGKNAEGAPKGKEEAAKLPLGKSQQVDSRCNNKRPHFCWVRSEVHKTTSKKDRPPFFDRWRGYFFLE